MAPRSSTATAKARNRTAQPAASMKKPGKPAAAASAKKKAAPARKRTPLNIRKKPAYSSARASVCPICLDALPDPEKRGLRSAGVAGVGGCGHEFCGPCLAQYCKVALADNKGLETGGALACPVPRCRVGTGLGPAEVKALVGEAAWEKHKERAVAHQVEMSTRMRFCPRVKCAAVNRVPGNAKGATTCVKCKKDFCAGCGLAAHGRKTCEQACDAEYGKWKGKHDVKPCPKCHRHIEKNGGCTHMHCVKCRADWCWTCTKLYTGTDPCTCDRFYYMPHAAFAPAVARF